MQKEILYEELKRKLELARNDDFIRDHFGKGMTIGVMYGMIGVYYQYGVISVTEYMELTDAISEAINEMVSDKKEGVSYDEPTVAK